MPETQKTTAGKRALRIGAGVLALAAFYVAVLIALDVTDSLTRPATEGWRDVLTILFLPLFLGITTLTVAGVLLARYAWGQPFFKRRS